ncbi:hypothetical protein B296_00030077 [Ensete ventricosum]|uniref:Uncharacterized protein n=1 Tax=Ensete ventricosum TaxID=4639 RepID=A0A426Y6I3_ENSVE|nr:hypothetical protein B296_00030077 [Ensete ventricosum]
MRIQLDTDVAEDKNEGDRISSPPWTANPFFLAPIGYAAPHPWSSGKEHRLPGNLQLPHPSSGVSPRLLFLSPKAFCVRGCNPRRWVPPVPILSRHGAASELERLREREGQRGSHFTCGDATPRYRSVRFARRVASSLPVDACPSAGPRPRAATKRGSPLIVNYHPDLVVPSPTPPLVTPILALDTSDRRAIQRPR